MNGYKLPCTLVFFLACSVLLVFSTDTKALDAGESGATRKINAIPDSTNEILKLTEEGIVPPLLKLSRSGSSVFFLNSTAQSLVGIEVSYGNKPGYCATAAMEMSKDGVFRSREPFAPKGFVAVCFPKPGTYPVKVFGLKVNPEGVKGTIVVE